MAGGLGVQEDLSFDRSNGVTCRPGVLKKPANSGLYLLSPKSRRRPKQPFSKGFQKNGELRLSQDRAVQSI